MRESLEEFFNNKLRVPAGVLGPSDIGFVRRVKSTKKAKIRDEVMVSFTSVSGT